MQHRTAALPAIAVPAIYAGLAGAALIEGYLIAVLVGIEHAVTVVQFLQFTASGLVGKAAYGDPRYALLGLAMHVAVSLMWAFGYAYVASRTPQVLGRPLVSGTVFGVVVMIAMQLIELAAGIWQVPTTFSFFNALVAHVAFFGIPVAYVVSRAGPARR